MISGCPPDARITEVPLDLAFLMDASGSLYLDNYDKEKTFVKSVIDKQLIGRRQTRVSVMAYSKSATIHVKFDQYFDKESLKSAVDEIPYESLNTRIDRALILAKEQLFSAANGARPYSRKVSASGLPFVVIRIKFFWLIMQNRKRRKSWISFG